MNKIPAFLILFAGLLTGCSLGSDRDAPTDRSVVLSNVTLIDGTGAPPQDSSVVVVEEGRIVRIDRVGEVEIPEGVTVVDLPGRRVLPGFIDVHTHMPASRALQEEILKTLLAFGVTTARTPAAGSLESGVNLRERIAAGEVLGPRFLASGWLINIEGSGFGIEVSNADEIRNVVRSQAEDGVDFVKLYVGLPPDLVEAAIDEAHRLGVRVIGHLGRTTWQEAAALDIDHLTHSTVYGMAHSIVPEPEQETFRNFFLPNAAFDPGLFPRWREVVDVQGSAFVALAQALIQRGISVDPNLVLAEAVLFGNDSGALARLEPSFAPDEQATNWRVPHPYSATWSADGYAEAQATFPLLLEAVRNLHERGVLLTVGTDLENPWMTPGVSFHRELELLVEAGLPPLEVLQIATRNGAESLGVRSEVGTIEEGKQADLVVIGGDPLQDISQTRDIELVLLNGERFEPRSLVQE